MKTKITYLTMALVIALSMALGGLLVVQAPPVAASPGAVTNVWVQFTTSTYNQKNTYTDFSIHFTPATALSRGADTITVWFPDGSTAMGPSNFILTDALTTTTFYTVDRDGEASTYSAVACVSTVTLSQSGYRITVKTPVDLDAGVDTIFRVAAGAQVKCANSDSHDPYYLKVYTSKDTTPVKSDAFNIDAAADAIDSTTLTLGEPYPGAAGQYMFLLETGDATQLTANEDTVTVIFPYGTTIPAAGGIAADQVSWSNNAGAGWSPGTALPVINQKARMITCTTPITLSTHDSNNYIKFSTGAGIMNPIFATTYSEGTTGTTWYVFTNEDELQVAEDGQAITAGTTGTKMGFNNDPFPSSSYSDDATMINMYTSALYLELQDTYGNLVNPATEPIVTMSSDKAGAFYTYDDSTYTQDNTVETGADGDAGGSADVYFVPSAAGTHTITADASAYGYTDGTWTLYVAPGVELYDSYDNLIKTYQPTAALPVHEEATVNSGDYVQSALSASVTGDTVKLGGSSGNPAIYELDTVLTLDQKITLTSKSGSALYTTLRPTADAKDALNITGTGTATNPITISYLTFDRKVVTGGTNYEFDQGVYNNGYDYVTVNGCTFNYITPANEADHEYGAVVAFIVYTPGGGGGANITSGTVSNNTFNNCCTFTCGAKSACINFMSKSGNKTISGVTVSENRLTDCNGYGIRFRGYDATHMTVTGSVTNNTITDGMSCINMSGYTGTSSSVPAIVTGNTITDAYSYGIKVEPTTHFVTIKNNTITGTVGSYAVRTEVINVTIQYNDIYNNNGYAIRVDSGLAAQDCQYNWYGSATGPAYTAVTGATVGKSNPGAGDPITDGVTYYPWLYKSKADVVTNNISYQTSIVALPVGWSTLSTPVELISAGDTIGELIPSGRSVGYWYDAFDADADLDYWELLQDSYELSPCDSVYVKMSLAKTVQLKFAADEFTTPSKALAAGWNMIGLAYLSTSGMETDDAVASVYLTATNMPGYSQVVSPSLNTTRKDMYYNQSTSWSDSRAEHGAASGLETMYASYGYWIYMLNAATLAGHTITPIAPDLD